MIFYLLTFNLKANKMKKFLILMFISFVLCNVYAQDVIVKKDGSTILSKVLEVNTTDIKYKKFSNLDGPSYSIVKSEIMSINYENGEKDVFDVVNMDNEVTSKASSQHYVKKPADARNAEIISWYNTIYQPTKKVKVKDKATGMGIAIIGVKSKSIMSNADIEMKIVRKIVDNPNAGGYDDQRYYINLTNKTDRTIYIDKGNCFRLDSKGESFCYYNDTEQTTINQGGGSGASLGLGSVARVLGVDGAIGQLADGINVSGGSSHSVSTTYSQQRVIAIPPHGNKNLVDDRWVKTKKGFALLDIDAEYKSIETAETFNLGLYSDEGGDNSYGLPRDGIKRGEVKIFAEDELSWKREYYITYSTEVDFRTYSTINAELFIHEIIGGAGDVFEDRKNIKYIQNVGEFTINATMIF